MDTFITTVQVIVALGIFNVWLVRAGRPTSWRGGDSTTLREEFRVYGLPAWFMTTVGALKLTCAALLLVGVWIPEVTRPAAIGLAVLMLGAVTMHLRVGDPMQRSLPALTMLALCVTVYAAY